MNVQECHPRLGVKAIVNMTVKVGVNLTNASIAKKKSYGTLNITKENADLNK